MIPSYFYLFFRLVDFPFLAAPVVRCLPEEVGFPLTALAREEVPRLVDFWSPVFGFSDLR